MTTSVVVQEGHVDANTIHRPLLVRSLGGHTIKAVSAGKCHTLALTSAGQALSFGLQTYGRLGREDADVGLDQPLTPGPISNLDGISVTGIAAGQLKSTPHASRQITI
jgi:hypothetical protein